MNVQTNIVRFPALTAALERSPARQANPDNVVAFSAADEITEAAPLAADHGQMFAARRIVARVAEQLDAISAL